jgi:hypothetical protein
VPADCRRVYLEDPFRGQVMGLRACPLAAEQFWEANGGAPTVCRDLCRFRKGAATTYQLQPIAAMLFATGKARVLAITKKS